VFSGGSRGWTYGHSWRGLQALHAETLGDPQVCIAVLDGPVVVAAVGNDGCACLQVPSAVPSVLAVGALAPDGTPLESNNWGGAYLANGVLAPGQAHPGAAPLHGREHGCGQF
jgi:hypothetical protein